MQYILHLISLSEKQNLSQSSDQVIETSDRDRCPPKEERTHSQRAVAGVSSVHHGDNLVEASEIIYQLLLSLQA